ncbi:MAG: histidine phosphatase family protein [Pseudomonadota bacterium]
MKVILVRHTETEWIARGMIQGRKDSALTEPYRYKTGRMIRPARCPGKYLWEKFMQHFFFTQREY